MHLIFQYDVDRLASYALNAPDQIQIVHEPDYSMLSFQNVNYFNFAFTATHQPFTVQFKKRIQDFYASQQIDKHRIIVEADCACSNAVFQQDSAYRYMNTIVQTALQSAPEALPSVRTDLSFVPVTHQNIDLFTDAFLKGFHAHDRCPDEVARNLSNMLHVKDMDLFLVKHKEQAVGINVAYRNQTESLLAEGAIVPEFRNRGFHKSSLAFRIRRAFHDNQPKQVMAWAYKNSVSLQNMLKLNMKVQQQYHVYESCQ